VGRSVCDVSSDKPVIPALRPGLTKINKILQSKGAVSVPRIEAGVFTTRRPNVNHLIATSHLTLSLLMYICGAPCKARNFNVIYMDLRLATLKSVSFYLLHNVSTQNQCRKLSCGTVVCKHFASYQGYPNYRWDLIRYAKG
jgi:hypothetical protein